jgi:hypothetical protein
MFMALSNLDYRLNTFDNLIFNNLRTNSFVLFIIWLLLRLLLLFFYWIIVKVPIINICRGLEMLMLNLTHIRLALWVILILIFIIYIIMIVIDVQRTWSTTIFRTCLATSMWRESLMLDILEWRIRFIFFNSVMFSLR